MSRTVILVPQDSNRGSPVQQLRGSPAHGGDSPVLSPTSPVRLSQSPPDGDHGALPHRIRLSPSPSTTTTPSTATLRSPSPVHSSPSRDMAATAEELHDADSLEDLSDSCATVRERRPPTTLMWRPLRPASAPAKVRPTKEGEESRTKSVGLSAASVRAVPLHCEVSQSGRVEVEEIDTFTT